MPRVTGFVIITIGLFAIVLGGQYFSQPQNKAPSVLYGGLVQSSNSLAQVSPEYAIGFPRDHQPHPDFAVEWWYFTSNLKSQSNPEQHYSVQFTLFRFNRGGLTQSAWSDGQLFMAHASIHTPQTHYFDERFATGGNRHAGVLSEPLVIQLDNWSWRSTTAELLPARLNIPLDDIELTLELTATGPIVLHGEQGYSRKSANGSHASMYYSQPFIHVAGELQTTQGNEVLVGQGWFDHEWTSQVLNEQTQGWDWFSLHLDNGEKLMAFRMRLNDQADHITGTLISPDGTARTLPPTALNLTPQEYARMEQRKYPSRWRLRIPHHGVDIELTPRKPDQWNQGRFPYYEGAVTITGSHSGVGFMELTGY
ncbi:lipocalin-like domain-containing protein [Alteromonas sp. ASW11-36]|uniref:Lipocalin-like domain-containing protein n=1 Tax=Alteromonas arenosi TaxID=3055817 RepID=A0ABT7SVT7_9ALTE|nr:lipocalin-like domain-containing protein [Alteromonas sp. ASW11-36]MDM7859664.1 lipocalin-like domain-containing protein [Alteromonas sp. ASW11-36]